MVIDMLGIKVWLDGYNVEITGVLPITDDVIVTTQTRWHGHNAKQAFPFSLPVEFVSK